MEESFEDEIIMMSIHDILLLLSSNLEDLFFYYFTENYTEVDLVLPYYSNILNCELFTSQYGDIEKDITVFGESKPIGSFINDCSRFQKSQLPFAVVLLTLCPLIFDSSFSVYIGMINFQRR